MACSEEYIEFICRTLQPLGDVRSRKMMGDYIVYVNDKCVITACDNTAYVKMLPCIAEMMDGSETGHPYPGAKECYILDFHDTHKTLNIIDRLWKSLPYPRTRKK